jgi:hypothetical protein
LGTRWRVEKNNQKHFLLNGVQLWRSGVGILYNIARHFGIRLVVNVLSPTLCIAGVSNRDSAWGGRGVSYKLRKRISKTTFFFHPFNFFSYGINSLSLEGRGR